MTSDQKPIRHRAILVTFGPPQPREGTVHLQNVLKVLGANGALVDGEADEQAWEDRMHHCVITAQYGAEASEQFSKALDDLAREIKDAEEKIIVYYGGHALQHADKGPKRFPKRPDWAWQGDTDHPACKWHLGAFDPVPAWKYFIKEVHNDVLLIFHCPFNVHRHFQCDLMASGNRPGRSVQLIHSTVPWSADSRPAASITNILSCKVALNQGVDDDCAAGMVVNIPAFSEDATNQLSDQLLAYHKKYATVHTLLDDLIHAAGPGRQAPYWKPLLGKPEDFVLSNPFTYDSYQRAVQQVADVQARIEAQSSSSDSDSETLRESEGAPSDLASHDGIETISGGTVVDSDDGSEPATLSSRPAVLPVHHRFPSFSATESSIATVSTYAPSIHNPGPKVRQPAIVVPQNTQSVAASVHSSGSTGAGGPSSHVGGNAGASNVYGGTGQVQGHAAVDDSSSSSSDEDGPASDGE